jgi:prohibitin 2
MAARPPPPSFSRVIAEFRKSMGNLGGLTTIPLVAGFMGITGYALYSSVYQVPGGYRAVKFNAITGLNDTNYGEGANLAIPFIETPILFDTRFRPTEVATSSGSRDLQIINMAVRVLYAPSVDKLHIVYRQLGVNYAETVLPSIIHEVMKAVIAQFNAGELLVQRSEVSSKIADLLRERASHFNINISDVAITQMTFGREYTAAVEAKQVAQQMAERAKFQVDQALQEKRGAILLAEGEAESATLIGNAMKSNPAFLELRKIEAAKAISLTLKTGKGQYFIDSDALMLNVTGSKA